MNAVSTFDIHDAASVCRTPIHEFFEQNWSALRNAAKFLGGRSAVLEAERLFEDLSHSLKIGVHTWRRLERMMRRLELDDDSVSEDVLLYVIDPSDPVVRPFFVRTPPLPRTCQPGSGENSLFG
jgi:hypothetical protein